MNTQKTLVISVGVLAVLNIALMIFILIGPNKGRPHKHRKHKRHEAIHHYFKKELGFDQEQMSKAKEQWKEHKLVMHPLFENLRHYNDLYFDCISSGCAQKDSIFSLLNTSYDSINHERYRHLESLLLIAKPEQKEDMLRLIKKISQHPMPPRRHP